MYLIYFDSIVLANTNTHDISHLIALTNQLRVRIGKLQTEG